MPPELATRAAQNMVQRPVDDPEGLVLEAWAQGFMVGTLVFMACITVANMRRRVLLHKLILAELILAMGHGTFIFVPEPAYGWYLSVTAIGLNVSWSLHNVIAWMKNKPFLSRKVSLFYIGTVILAQPYWVLEIYANFTYFNNINKIFEQTRPWETLCRDPWWIYTTCNLFWVIKSQYDFGIIELCRHSPRFGIMLTSMCVSVAFIIVDLLSVLGVFKHALPMGINPFWKLSFVFKCLCDTVILDDFKTALDRLRDYWFVKNDLGPITNGSIPPGDLRRTPPGAANRRHSFEMHRNFDANNHNNTWPTVIGPGWEPRKLSLTDLGVIEPVRKRGGPGTALGKEKEDSVDRYDSCSIGGSENTARSHSQSHPDRMV